MRRLFKAAGGKSIKKKLPKATFLDFHGCGSFHRPPLPNFSFFFGSFSFFVEIWAPAEKLFAPGSVIGHVRAETGTWSICLAIRSSFLIRFELHR